MVRHVDDADVQLVLQHSAEGLRTDLVATAGPQAERCHRGEDFLLRESPRRKLLERALNQRRTLRVSDRLDPFALAARIDLQLERVYALASVRPARSITMAGGGEAAGQTAAASPPPPTKTASPSLTPFVARRLAVR